MAFFDDIGRKLSQATQATAQKAKDIADVSRINGAISDEERKVNNNYYQIGKLYVAMHPNDHEADFAALIASIKDSERKIIEYRNQIQEIKGVTRCEKCGAEVAMNMAFCSSCGSPMPKNASNQDAGLIKCTGCGQMISKDVRFCTSCGKPMADIMQYYAPQQPSTPQQPVAPQQPAAPMQPAAPQQAPEVQQAPMVESAPQSMTCPGCGSTINEEMIFCTGCGIKLK